MPTQAKLTITYDNGLGQTSSITVEGIKEDSVEEYLKSDSILYALGFYPCGVKS